MSFDVADIRKQHLEAVQKIQKASSEALLELGAKVQANVLETTAFKGEKLRRQVKLNPNGIYSLEVSMDSKVAVFMNDGTKPHTIAARNAQFLRFVSSSGSIIFRRIVHHPGTKATHFFDIAAQTVYSEFEEKLDEKLNALNL